MATIEAYHEGLADGVVEADTDTLATLQDATGRLQRLVEDLSLVSRAEEGQLGYDLRPVDLGELVSAAVEAAFPAARERGLQIQVQTPDVPVFVQGDRDRLAQVLANLLNNALQHTPRGGTVAASLTVTPSEAVVAVADTGAGIAPEHLPHVFERFFRADPSRRHVAGSGIGLTIAEPSCRDMAARSPPRATAGPAAGPPSPYGSPQHPVVDGRRTKDVGSADLAQEDPRHDIARSRGRWRACSAMGAARPRFDLAPHTLAAYGDNLEPGRIDVALGASVDLGTEQRSPVASYSTRAPGPAGA